MSTPNSPDVLVIAASNGENLKLAQRIADAARALGKSADLIDLTSLDLPLFTPRIKEQGMPAGVRPLQGQLLDASRWVICAPEYNGSIPPVLTSAIAWLSVQGEDFRSLFNGRPVAMASISGGPGIELLVSLRIQLTHLGAQVVGRTLAGSQTRLPKDSSIQDLLNRLLQMSPLEL